MHWYAPRTGSQILSQILLAHFLTTDCSSTTYIRLLVIVLQIRISLLDLIHVLTADTRLYRIYSWTLNRFALYNDIQHDILEHEIRCVEQVSSYAYVVSPPEHIIVTIHKHSRIDYDTHARRQLRNRYSGY